MVTYWLALSEERSDMRSSTEDSSTNFDDHSCEDLNLSSYNLDDPVRLDDKTSRLVSWNTQVLLRLLKLVVGSRPEETFKGGNFEWTHSPNGFMSEVAEVIALPDAQDPDFAMIDENMIELSKETKEELFDYVESIAKLYRSNPFHNFEHASHVVMVSRTPKCGREVKSGPFCCFLSLCLFCD